jgi:ABC-type polysaccharide/polyol phosphate export permease
MNPVAVKVLSDNAVQAVLACFPASNSGWKRPNKGYKHYVKNLVLNIYNGRHVLKTMVIKDIKAKYTGSVLGPVWILLIPLYQVLLYTFIFSVIMKVRFEEGSGTSSFVLYLLAGMIPWIFFSEATIRGISTFIENATIIKNVKFPIEICALSVVISHAFTFFVYMVFYMFMLIFMGVMKIQLLPLIILPFLIQSLMIAGFSFGLGSVAVFFRDITQASGMVLNLVFFLTPIVYPPSSVPERLRWIYNLNPGCFIVDIYRSLLVKGRIPDPASFAYPFIFALIIFLAGYYIFIKTKAAFKDIL